MIKKTRERKKANPNTCNSIDIDCTYMIAAYKRFKRKINT